MRVAQQQSNRCTGALCILLGYSRQAFYKFNLEEEKEVFLQDLVVQKVLEIRKLQRRIGGRKLYFMLSPYLEKHEIKMGRDAFFDLLRKEELPVRIRRRKTITTDSNHYWRRYPNLIKDFIPLAINQLWVSDITYIIIVSGFGYLSLITDVFSHKVIGFHLSRDLKAEGCVETLNKALKDLNINNRPPIHHSDRGVQYCCFGYVEILKEKGVEISTTQNGDPKENDVAERMNGILKVELLQESYPDFKTADEAIAKSVSIYNHFRPHNSIGNLTPHQAHTQPGLKPKKLWKTYYKSSKKGNKQTNV
jgi:transposase InsO family protein